MSQAVFQHLYAIAKGKKPPRRRCLLCEKLRPIPPGPAVCKPCREPKKSIPS